MIENRITLRDTAEIKDRAERLRSKVDMDWASELGDSIAVQGLLVPILVNEEGVLIAGEHRLEAFRRNARLKLPCAFKAYAGWTRIPSIKAVTEDQGHLMLELIENLLRKGMDWRDEAKGIYLFAQNHEQGEEEDVADYSARLSLLTGISASKIQRYLNIESRIHNPQVQAATNLNEARNIVARHRKRELDSIMDSVSGMLVTDLDPALMPAPSTVDFTQDQPQEKTGVAVATALALDPAPSVEVIPTDGTLYKTINGSFIDFANNYTGKPFNFVHCDFPYGVNMDKSSMTNADAWGTYADSEDIYFELLGALLANKDKLLSKTSFVMFWYSEKFGERTRKEFELAGFKRWTHPLIWHKSCNSGILPDYRRGARHTYENAMVFTLGDPFIVSPVADSWSGPATKDHGHVSEKPEAMLSHFFRMFIDEFTYMLDPTAGSFTSCKVAIEQGGIATGIELDPQHHANGSELLAKTERKLNAL